MQPGRWNIKNFRSVQCTEDRFKSIKLPLLHQFQLRAIHLATLQCWTSNVIIFKPKHCVFFYQLLYLCVLHRHFTGTSSAQHEMRYLITDYVSIFPVKSFLNCVICVMYSIHPAQHKSRTAEFVLYSLNVRKQPTQYNR